MYVCCLTLADFFFHIHLLKCICAPLKSKIKTCAYKQDFVTSLSQSWLKMQLDQVGCGHLKAAVLRTLRISLNSAVADSVSIIFEINNISNEREKVDAI